MKTIRTTHWHPEYHCKSCNKILSYDSKMDNHGICPLCGYDSNCTICNTTTVIVREIITTTINWKYPFIHTTTTKETKDNNA